MSLDKSLAELLQEVFQRSVDYNNPSISDDGLVGHCLRESITYRLPESAKTDRLVGFRMMKRCLEKVRNPGKILDNASNTLIIQGNANHQERIQQYIAFQSKQSTPYFFSKEAAPLINQVLHPSDLRSLKRVYFRIAIQCFFKKDRQHRSIWPWAALEAWSLLQFVNEKSIKKVFDFSPYLIDANWYSLLLMREGVEVWRIPSSGPLNLHNKYMIGDAATFSTPYQLIEKDKFNDTIRPKQIHKWVPEQAMNYIESYIKKPKKTEENTIGFYSHASWIRKTEGHSDNGLNIHIRETQLLEHLTKILKDKPNLNLKIFLHPRERNMEIFGKTEAYYSRYFPNTKYTFSNPTTPSSRYFDQVDIGIAVYSTILYERLFCGFKSLIGNYDMIDFPDPSSSLTNICFQSYEELKERLEEATKMNHKMFFKQMKLEEYRYDSYPIIKEMYPTNL